MKYLLSIILFPAICFAQQELGDDFEDPLMELELPPVLDFDKPKPKPKKVNPISNDDYCLCKCVKKGNSPARSKFFKGKKDGQGCLCECLVK